MQQYGTLVNIWPVIQLGVNDFLKKRQSYVWYQDNIFLADNSLVGPFQFVTTGRKK